MDSTPLSNVQAVERFVFNMKPAVSLSNSHRLRKLKVLHPVLKWKNYRKARWSRPDLRTMLPKNTEEITICCPNRRVLHWLEDVLYNLDFFEHLGRIELVCRALFGKPATFFKPDKHSVLVKLAQSGATVEVTQEQFKILDVSEAPVEQDKIAWMEVKNLSWVDGLEASKKEQVWGSRQKKEKTAWLEQESWVGMLEG
ncbi:hypothetical protein DM02DRAFT_653025 [Periconia macrospinosa]|uniref:Uncharacterized protein n=1 Tax=Periconia macrospinosa TaxID=97972 RepID=A0A2V1DYD8_9PLEO|nr:hypothetical protein DM02DRAFT_653025 [Periconia macrospinosa]